MLILIWGFTLCFVFAHAMENDGISIALLTVNIGSRCGGLSASSFGRFTPGNQAQVSVMFEAGWAP